MKAQKHACQQSFPGKKKIRKKINKPLQGHQEMIIIKQSPWLTKIINLMEEKGTYKDTNMLQMCRKYMGYSKSGHYYFKNSKIKSV